MTAIANAVIEKVYPGTEGESEHGPWRAYNFTIEGSDLKFGYFWGEGKAVPREGMMLEVLQYTTKQNGKYTNHTVKKLEIVADTNPTEASEHQKGAKGPQTATQPQQTASVVRKDVKGIKMGMIGCAKAVHNPTDSVDQQFYKAEKLFKAIELFVLRYDGRPDLESIQNKINSAGLPDEFWDWLVTKYKVNGKLSLLVTDTIYTADNFDKAGALFLEELAKKIKADHQETPQQDEDVHREQTFAEALVEGPEETTFPDDEVCPEPAEEMPPF